MIDPLILSFLILVVSLTALMWSAERMLDGALGLAHDWKVSTITVGLLTGIATSAPELVVSAIAAFEGQPRIGLGNALGSNIANIALVLGAGVLLSAIAVDRRTSLIKILILGLAFVLLGVLMWDNVLQQYDGVILLLALIPLLYYSIKFLPEPLEHDTPNDSWLLNLSIGLVILLLASYYTVDSAVSLARGLGIDEIVISLSIIAIGTSLPELATVIASVRRKHYGVAVGNVFGSNLFNALGIVGVTALIHPITLDTLIIERDFFAMIAVTIGLLLLLLIGSKGDKFEINRWKGFVLLAGFLIYLSVLYQTTFIA